MKSFRGQIVIDDNYYAHKIPDWTSINEPFDWKGNKMKWHMIQWSNCIFFLFDYIQFTVMIQILNLKFFTAQQWTNEIFDRLCDKLMYCPVIISTGLICIPIPNSNHLIIIELIESDLKSNTFFSFFFPWSLESVYRFDWMVPWKHWPKYFVSFLYRYALWRQMIDIFDKIGFYINSIDYRTNLEFYPNTNKKTNNSFEFGSFIELTGFHSIHSYSSIHLDFNFSLVLYVFKGLFNDAYIVLFGQKWTK